MHKRNKAVLFAMWVRFVFTGQLPGEDKPTITTPPARKSVLDALMDADDDAIEDLDRSPEHWGQRMDAMQSSILAAQPRISATVKGTAQDGSEDKEQLVTAMDSVDDGGTSFKAALVNAVPNLSEAITGFFLRQTFIGHQLAGMLAQHWLIDKCCTMPARDAIRHWFEIRTQDGDELEAPEILNAINRIDKRLKLRKACLEYIRMGRMFGVRIAIYKVDSTDPHYYEQPFNIDGVTPGSYKGIVQVDPYWAAPELNGAAAAQPDSMNFYEPTYWQINGQRYHRSHLAIFRNADPIDILKPVYLYGGIPVPQLIVERVYAAERTANEAPQLAMTKRTTVLKTDTTKVFSDPGRFFSRLNSWVSFRDNYGVKVIDSTDDDLQQFDTSLADLDAVIMTGYQLVAAAARVPATKLLGTSPKGFNASGEYEAENYHEELESIQENDLTEFVERHHMYVMRSEILPNMRRTDPTFQEIHTSVSWNPVDSPTASEYADIQYKKSQTGFQLVQSGAIDGYDERDRVRNDKDGDYLGIAEAIRPPSEDEDGEAGVTPGAVGAKNTTARADVEKAQQPATASAGDSLDATPPEPLLITNQSYIDPDIVNAKRVIGDYCVQVSPVFTDAVSGVQYRVVIDGHHSLAAARADGVAPILQEATFDVGDYAVV